MVACFAGELSVNGVSPNSIDAADGCLTLPEGTYLTVSVVVRNVGDQPGPANLCAQSDGRTIIDRRTRDLSPGESTTAHVGIGRLGPGMHLLAVALAPVPQCGDLATGPSTPGPSPQPVADHNSCALRALDDDVVEAVLVALERAARAGLSFRRLMEAILTVAPPSFRWPKLFGWDVMASAEVVRRALADARVESDTELRVALDELVCALDGLSGAGVEANEAVADRPDAVDLECEPATRHWWSWWDAGAVGRDENASEEGIDRIVAITVDRPAPGDERLTLVLHTIETQHIDVGRLLDDPAATSALVALAADPADPARRELAVAAVAGGRGRVRTADYVAVASLARSASAAVLDGTVTIIRSHREPVADGEGRDNSVVAVLSPSVDAAAMLSTNPGLVSGLVDVVASGAGAAEMAGFEKALSRDLTTGQPAENAPRAPLRRGPVLDLLARPVGVLLGHRRNQG